jgi:hypothetical protein
MEELTIFTNELITPPLEKLLFLEIPKKSNEIKTDFDSTIRFEDFSEFARRRRLFFKSFHKTGKDRQTYSRAELFYIGEKSALCHVRSLDLSRDASLARGVNDPEFVESTVTKPVSQRKSKKRKKKNKKRTISKIISTDDTQESRRGS